MSTDTERLDWFERHHSRLIDDYVRGEPYGIHSLINVWHFFGDKEMFRTLREAIDYGIEKERARPR